jgi:hypothetical protein
MSWLPVTPAPNDTKVPPDRSSGTDCGIYRPAWQHFLYATQLLNGSPRFLSFPSFDQIFTNNMPQPKMASLISSHVLMLSPRNEEGPNDFSPASASFFDISQAGLRGVLIDQKGNPIYYAIYVDPSFAQFLKSHNLAQKDPKLIQKNFDPTLSFPSQAGQPMVMELKSAWMIVDSKSAAPSYIVVPAVVPRYVISPDGLVVAEINPTTKLPVTRNVYVALIALHVVFTLPGHPEMIWSTFEHVHFDAKGNSVRDNAPAAPANPSNTPSNAVISRETSFPLYQAGTVAGNANRPIDPKILAAHFDVDSQTFTKGGLLQTSVYRPYPASKTTETDEDDEVTLINDNIGKMFSDATTPASDLRQNYRLVGAVWINDPSKDFKVNSSFIDPINLSTDDPSSVLAGEGRLGSTSMESFTEFEDSMPGGSPNCFSCHDTNKVVDDQPPHKKLLPAGLLNVSHVISRYIDQSTPGN